MSKEKKFFSPSQMMFLTGTTINDGQTGGKREWAKPDPFLDEEEEIILPDGGSVATNGEDVIIAPDSGADFSTETDEAYY